MKRTQRMRGRKAWGWLLIIAVTMVFSFGTTSPVQAESFDQKVAKNGTGFTKLSDAEKTAFLVFGSNATKADGMQHRWKMLTKSQVTSITGDASARAAFGDFGYNIWTAGQNFSTTSDGKTLTFDTGVKGIDIKMLARGYGIVSNSDTKTQLTTVDKSGKAVRTTSHAFEKSHYYFSDMSTTGVNVDPLLKVADGAFSLRVGQTKVTETTAHQWKNDIKALQIDTVTTATQRPDVVFSVEDGGATAEYVLSDIVDAGQYKAQYAYYGSGNAQVVADVEGARLSDVLATKSISVGANDKVVAKDDQGKEYTLSSPVTGYFIAYKGTETVNGGTATAMTSNSEFCLFGPGKTEAEVKVKSLYSIKITRAKNDSPGTTSGSDTKKEQAIKVTKPKGTKITKLTKKGKKAIKIKWKKGVGIDGYQISMATKKKGKYKVIKTVTKAKTISFTKKKLKKGKKYFFKIRTYKKANGKKIYSKWSAVKYKKL